MSDRQLVRAQFADGSEAEGDLLVGCDGVHSRTRQIIDPRAATPSYTGLLSCGGYTATTTLPPTPETQHLIFGRRAFFGYFVKQSGEAWWFSNIAYPGEPRRSELAQVTHEQWQRRLLDLHAGDQPFINELIRGTTEPLAMYPISTWPPHATGGAARWCCSAMLPTRRRRAPGRALRSRWRTRSCWRSVCAKSHS